MALDISDEILTGKTAKRYYSGININEFDRKQIYLALGRRLLSSGIVPASPILAQDHISMMQVTALSLIHLAKKWDSLLARIESRSGKVEGYRQATLSFCRLFIIDIALRISAWARLTGLAPPGPASFAWANSNGAGKLLRSTLSTAGITREQFGARVGVTPVSIDNWLDGKIRPSLKNVVNLAEALEVLVPGTFRQTWQKRLQREFTLGYLGDMIASVTGREAVVGLTTSLQRFTRILHEDIDSSLLKQSDGQEILARLLRNGVDAPESRALLLTLVSRENDDKWKRDILASMTSWGLRFEEIAISSAAPHASAGLAQALPAAALINEKRDGTGEDIERLAATSALQPQDYMRVVSGDLSLIIEFFTKGIEDRRKIVKAHPTSPRAHMELGSYLGMISRYLRDDHLMVEAIQECKIAAALCPGWDTPLVESGIILGNAGRYADALAELDMAANTMGAVTPHLANCRGYVLLQLKRCEEALRDFETVIQTRPDFGSALDDAAHCAFLIGDRLKAIRYAKMARKYGVSSSFSEWRRGSYDKM
ncbi:hypothetical protein C1G87_0908 [Dehalococcoides mccartyi]|nr:hypothetical protein C1G87_0908 [Dehalococcoides mccartyi]